MPENEKTTAKTTGQSTGKTATDDGRKAIEALFLEAEQKGYFGVTPDQAPRSEYTLQGRAKQSAAKGQKPAKNDAVVSRENVAGQ